MNRFFARLLGVLAVVCGSVVFASVEIGKKARRDELQRIEATPTLWPEYTAIKLAVAANMRSKTFTERCGGFFDRSEVTSTVVVVPINADIVGAAGRFVERYQTKFGTSDPSRRAASLRAWRALADQDTVTFAMFVINSDFDESRSEVAFQGGLGGALALQDERGRASRPSRYTRNFDEKLSSGANAGFFYVPNPNRNRDVSYTLHVSNLRIKPCSSATPVSRTATFVYTKYNFDYLALVRSGITEVNLYSTIPELRTAETRSNMDTIKDAAAFVSLINGIITIAKTLRGTPV